MSEVEKLIGVVVEVMESKLFRVRLSGGKSELIAGVTEELRRTIVRVRAGDKVFVIPSSADPTRGRIVGTATRSTRKSR